VVNSCPVKYLPTKSSPVFDALSDIEAARYRASPLARYPAARAPARYLAGGCRITREARMPAGWRNVSARNDFGANREDKACAISGVVLQDNAQKPVRFAIQQRCGALPRKQPSRRCVEHPDSPFSSNPTSEGHPRLLGRRMSFDTPRQSAP
jgi:hypothetical protein